MLYSFILGLKFWKIPSRKVFAVHRDSLRGKSRSRPPDVNASSEGSVEKRLCNIEKSLQQLHASLWFQRPKDTPPDPIKELLSTCFRCTICHLMPIKPPVIAAKCCGMILGCRLCVDTWYSGEDGVNKPCPLCKKDRGFCDTFILRGLDDFLHVMKNTLEEDDA